MRNSSSKPVSNASVFASQHGMRAGRGGTPLVEVVTEAAELDSAAFCVGEPLVDVDVLEDMEKF